VSTGSNSANFSGVRILGLTGGCMEASTRVRASYTVILHFAMKTMREHALGGLITTVGECRPLPAHTKALGP